MASRHDVERTFTFFNEINIIAQLSSNLFRRRLPHGLTESQFSVLNWFVRVDTEATPGRLATAFMVTRGAMTNTLAKLEEKAFIRIEPDAVSGRQKKVTMTKTGRAARDEAIAASASIFAEFNKHIDARETERLLPALQAIRQYLDESRYAQSS